jgi:peptide/nickel transport system permease protein
MQRYLLRRLLLLPVILLFVSMAVFAIVRVIPGDPAQVILTDSAQIRRQDYNDLRQKLGLNDPIPVAYAKWLGGLLRGDLGSSLFTNRPVSEELMRAAPISMELALLALFFSAGIGVIMGLLAAIMQNSPADYGTRFISIVWLSLPGFWLGTLVIIFGARWFGWVPPVRYQSLLANPADNLTLFLPAAIVLGMHTSAVVMRYTRSALLDVLRQDYIRTARAKGLASNGVYLSHALRNALLPVVTIAGLQFAALLGGTVTLETVFNLPGIGRLLIGAVRNRDYPVVQGTVLYISAAVIIVNLIVDISYAALNPRLRSAGSGGGPA